MAALAAEPMGAIAGLDGPNVRLDDDGYVIEEEEEEEGLEVEEVAVGVEEEKAGGDLISTSAAPAPAPAKPEIVLDPDVKAEILERLVAVRQQWKEDEFWSSLANPVDRALKALDRGEVAHATEHLDALVMHLPGGTIGPLKSLPPEGMLSEQRKEIRICLRLLLKAAAPEVEPPPIQEDEIVFVQHPYDSEMTLRIKVPPTTKSKDAIVKFEERRLTVKVTGHARSPVVDGTLFEKIHVDDSAWFLEGEGPHRVLVVHLEKNLPKKVWPTLYKALGPPEAGSLESGEDFWSVHDREHEAHHRKQGTWTAK